MVAQFDQNVGDGRQACPSNLALIATTFRFGLEVRFGLEERIG